MKGGYYEPHGQRVVQHVVQHGDLLLFQARWRRHFVDTMRPAHLPAYWTVDYVPENWPTGPDHAEGGEGEGVEEEEEGARHQESLGGGEEEEVEDDDEDEEEEDDECSDDNNNGHV